MDVELRLRWWERAWFIRALGLFWLVFGVVLLSQFHDRAKVGSLLASFALAVAFGVVLWLFDRWWGERKSVRTVRASGGEFARRAPTGALYLVGILLAWWWDLSHEATGTVLVFVYTTIAMLYFLVLPGLERRRVERRAIRATLPVRPDIGR